jgi:glycyl-tRNA synthetase
MRNQARAIAELYVKQREEEEFPWLPVDQVNGKATSTASVKATMPDPASVPLVSSPQDFLLELGSEELPPQDVVDGIAQIEEKVRGLLESYRLDYKQVRVTGTTRRLVAYVTGLATRQNDEVVEKRGPALDRAFDSAGAPTKAAEGFARGQGVDVHKLEQREGYLYAVKRVVGQPTLAVLPNLCRDLMDSLRWGKTMRWNSSGMAYPRPLRWLVALYGDHPVTFTWAGVTSGATSRGPRFADAAAHLPPGEFTTFAVANPAAYFDAVARQGIVVDRSERRALIAKMVEQTAAQVKGQTPDDPALLDEVTDLVEAPQALLGHFEERYLDLPMAVLIGVMKKHQRYFPVIKDGKLLPNFITIANAANLAHPDVVVAGNEGVIRARYSDANFFYRQDTERKLETFTPRLATLTFHEKLGSMLDKVKRLEQLAPQIATMLGASADDVATVERAAALSKSDLVTHMVIEMTSLQGIMGEIYAKTSGETPEVAQAIREHYLPRSAGDANPASIAGLALSLADKLDSLAGLFAVGAIPTGSADPYGLRRAALGIVYNLLSSRVSLSIRKALTTAAALQPMTVGEESIAETAAFVTRRLQGVLLEQGFSHDVVEAVLAVRGDNPVAAQVAATNLQIMVNAGGWEGAFTAYARCARITRTLETKLPLNPSAYQEKVEDDLHRQVVAACANINAAPEPALILSGELFSLAPAINAFFDKVLVNADDPTVRQARLALVQQIALLPASVADLSKLQGF